MEEAYHTIIHILYYKLLAEFVLLQALQGTGMSDYDAASCHGINSVTVTVPA
jgi:hypothetical protein